MPKRKKHLVAVGIGVRKRLITNCLEALEYMLVPKENLLKFCLGLRIALMAP